MRHPAICSYAHCLRARKVLRQQLRHGVCCVHSLASTCSCSAHVVSPGVLSVSKFARKALATSKEGVQVHWLGGRLCFGGGFWGGGSLKAPTQRSERSTRLPQAQRFLTTYKRRVPNPNTAMPLLVFHGAHMRGLSASGAAMVRLEQPLAPPWRRRRSSIWPRDMAVEWL